MILARIFEELASTGDEFGKTQNGPEQVSAATPGRLPPRHPAAIMSHLGLLALWAVILLVVGPGGEFSINDDWSFVFGLKTLILSGRIGPTGWGPGGPALITHLLWAALFTGLFGFSLTTLRLAVLAMAVIASQTLLALLRRLGAATWLALAVTLTLIFNPLFLSQSFTFMTDVTFTGFMALALFFFHRCWSKSSTGWVVAALLASLAAMLARQIGLVLPLAFLLVCLFRPEGRTLGRGKMIVLILVLTIGPWMAWEAWLSATGSTPVTRHEVFRNISGNLTHRGLAAYLVFVYTQLFHAALGYLAFMVSPVLLLQSGPFWRRRSVRRALAGWVVVVAAFELALLAGWFDAPVIFYRNVIINFGIGPLLYKDTYILGLPRLDPLPAPLYYLMVGWTVPMVVLLLARVAGAVRRFLAHGPINPTGALALAGAGTYLGIITLTGFHDRYLIPVILLVLVWLTADPPVGENMVPSRWTLPAAGILLLLMAWFSVAGTHDFMVTKRAAKAAQDYLVQELKVDPCRMDGGFEFNGSHCYRSDFQPRPGLSWWWVDQEDYLIALGTLPGYRTVRTFPFHRYLGSDGAIHVLAKPDS